MVKGRGNGAGASVCVCVSVGCLGSWVSGVKRKVSPVKNSNLQTCILKLEHTASISIRLLN